MGLYEHSLFRIIKLFVRNIIPDTEQVEEHGLEKNDTQIAGGTLGSH